MWKRLAAGFTLLEVLVALVILSLGFAAMIYSINTNTRSLIAIEDTTSASWVAANVVAKAHIGLLQGASAGTEEQFGHTYYWEVEREGTQNEDVDKIQITVSKVRGGAPLISLTAYEQEVNNAQ